MVKSLLSAVLSLGLLSIACGAESVVGYIEPGRTIKVSSAEPGVLSAVAVEEGQAVSKQDVLVKLDTAVLEQELKIAEAECKLLERRATKLSGLQKKKYASEDEVLRAQSDLEISRLRQQRTKAQIERRTLRSPIDGVVAELRYEVAESVSGANAHVVTVVNLDPMMVQLAMPIPLAAALKVGDQISLSFPDLTVQRPARITFISPVATAVVNTVRVKATLANQDRSLPAGTKCIYSPQPSDSSNL